MIENGCNKAPVRPSYDEELRVGLEAALPRMQRFVSADNIYVARTLLVSAPDKALTRNGEYTLEDRLVAGPEGAPNITLLICRPNAASTAVPVIYYIHGGGMVMGNRRTGLPGVLDLAASIGAAVISVEYRLAPETQHPGPVEDCYAGLDWLGNNPAALDLLPDSIVIAGTSAGGGLAAATALLARDRGGPRLAGQLLMGPMLDDRNESLSAHQMEGVGVWDRTANGIGWTALLGEKRGSASVSQYASPARATNLGSLPPTLIDVGSAETFRDEAVVFASRIWADGGDCELHVFAGGFHGYDSLVPETAVSRDTVEARKRWLARATRGCNIVS